MTGWLLIIVVTLNGYVHGDYPAQIGPFATKAACESASALLHRPPADHRDDPLLPHSEKWVCVPEATNKISTSP